MDFLEQKNQLAQHLRIDEKKSRLKEIEQVMGQTDFWQKTPQPQIQELLKEGNALRGEIKEFELLQNPKELKDFENRQLAIGPYDKSDAILIISAGAGGQEAQDWAKMLLRMYLKFAEISSRKPIVLDESFGEGGGIKSVTLKVAGENVYRLLRGEAGVHRLVRLSPFDADHARHTSFALVEVIPVIENPEVEIQESDLKIEAFRSSGHGGQSVNTTDSAVRVTHRPTGIVVSVQNERSQLQNKETALSILASKLSQLAREKKDQEEKALRAQASANWGSQIRSYVLHPYKKIKDHRTHFETDDAQSFLNGRILPALEAYRDYLVQTNINQKSIK